MDVSNARRDDQDQQRPDQDQLMRELDDALTLLVNAEDTIERLTAERDNAREWAVRLENDERRSRAEADEAIKLLLERDARRLAELESLTIRNKDLELALASRRAS